MQNNFNFADFGKAVALLSASNASSRWPSSLVNLYFYPAIYHAQYVLINSGNGNPLAYASWSYLSIETELKYLSDPHSLLLDEWRSGDRLWIMHMISPFSNDVTQKLIKHLRVNLFPNDVAQVLRVKSNLKHGSVKVVSGVNVLPPRKKEVSRHLWLSSYNCRHLITGDRISWQRPGQNQ